MFAEFTKLVSPTYNSPQLVYPAIGANPALTIPLHITDYKVSTRNAKMNPITGLPLLHPLSNNAVRGVQIGAGTMELPKIVLAGHIDTPSETIGVYRLPSFKWRGQVQVLRITYGDFIAMCMEGRANQFDTAIFSIIDPTHFRDPFGRMYYLPRVTSFTGSYLEGVPCRQNFQMTLNLTAGSDI